MGQFFWIANLPYQTLEDIGMVGAAYSALLQNELSAMIPIDNLRKAVREKHIDKSNVAAYV
jgi:hypothetical protein